MTMENIHTQNPTEETEVDRMILERLIRLLEPETDQESLTKISFFVRNKVVTLSGTASDAEEREALIARIHDTEGVERIINRLTDRQSPR